jgi:hypothetical protein
VKTVALDNDHSLYYIQANCSAVSPPQTAWGFKSTVIEHGLLSLKPEQIHNGPEANDKERYDTRMRSSNVIKWLQQTEKYTALLLRDILRPKMQRRNNRDDTGIYLIPTFPYETSYNYIRFPVFTNKTIWNENTFRSNILVSTLSVRRVSNSLIDKKVAVSIFAIIWPVNHRSNWISVQSNDRSVNVFPANFF